MSDGRILLSLDIDGTMEFGDPPGIITVSMALDAIERGLVVGSASDRTSGDQQNLWDHHGVPVDFVGQKHRLELVRERYDVSRCVHIGDTDVDRYYALKAGFEFHFVHELPDLGSPGWLW